MKEFILSVTDTDGANPSTFTVRGRVNECVIEDVIDMLEEDRQFGGQRSATCTCDTFRFRQNLLEQAIECERIKENLLDMVEECEECNPGLTDDELRRERECGNLGASGAIASEIELDDAADKSEDDSPDDGTVSYLFTRFFNKKSNNRRK